MMLHTLRPWLACTMLTLLIPSWILAHPAPPSRQDESPAAEGSTPAKLRGRLVSSSMIPNARKSTRSRPVTRIVSASCKPI